MKLIRGIIFWVAISTLTTAFADDRNIIVVKEPTTFLDGASLRSHLVRPGVYAVESLGNNKVLLRSKTSSAAISWTARELTHSNHTNLLEASIEKTDVDKSSVLYVFLPNGRLLVSTAIAGTVMTSNQTQVIPNRDQIANAWELSHRFQFDTDSGSRVSNSATVVRIDAAKPNSTVVYVKYTFIGDTRCRNGSARITAKPTSVDDVLFQSESRLISQSDLGAIEPRSTTAIVNFLGISPLRSNDWELAMTCESESGSDEITLSRTKFSSPRVWTYDPPDDQDGDGIADAAEQSIALKYAPELRLADDEDAKPSSVDWYLRRVSMRFNHTSGCKDHQVKEIGAVTQANIASQKHRDTAGALGICHHDGQKKKSDSSDRFFLQPQTAGLFPEGLVQPSTTHNGDPDISNWKAYFHMLPMACGTYYKLQYWFFYPYNKAWQRFNHEGDWESVNIFIGRNGERLPSAGISYSQHNGQSSYLDDQIKWVNLTHPVVFVAKGTHANYNSIGTFHIPDVPSVIFEDKTNDTGVHWQTWRGIVNVGEIGNPLNGQSFISYGGLWGEVGSMDMTTGPRGPAFHSDFDHVSHCGSSPSPSDGMICPEGSYCCDETISGKCRLCVRRGGGSQCP